MLTFNSTGVFLLCLIISPLIARIFIRCLATQLDIFIKMERVRVSLGVLEIDKKEVEASLGEKNDELTFNVKCLKNTVQD